MREETKLLLERDDDGNDNFMAKGSSYVKALEDAISQLGYNIFDIGEEE